MSKKLGFQLEEMPTDQRWSKWSINKNSNSFINNDIQNTNRTSLVTQGRCRKVKSLFLKLVNKRKIFVHISAFPMWTALRGKQIGYEGKVLYAKLIQIINDETMIELEYIRFEAPKELMNPAIHYVTSGRNKWHHQWNLLAETLSVNPNEGLGYNYKSTGN